MADLCDVRRAVWRMPEVDAIDGLDAMPVRQAFAAIIERFGLPQPDPGDSMDSVADVIVNEAMRRKGA